MIKIVERVAYKWSSHFINRAMNSRMFAQALAEQKSDFVHEVSMNKTTYCITVEIQMPALRQNSMKRGLFVEELLNLLSAYSDDYDSRIIATELYVANNQHSCY